MPLRRGLDEAADPRLKAQFHLHLGMALRRQRKDDEALAACDQAQKLDPGLPGLALHRAEALQNLRRHDEALAVLRNHLARKPGDPGPHHVYNDLLYRLGRNDEFLKSYDRAPQSRELLLGKAFFLARKSAMPKRMRSMPRCWRAIPATSSPRIGVANALTMMRRHGEAVAAFEACWRGMAAMPTCSPRRRAGAAARRSAEGGLAVRAGPGSCRRTTGPAWRCSASPRA